MLGEFDRFVARKTAAAEAAQIGTLVTESCTAHARHVVGIGNLWTRQHYGGDFWLQPAPDDIPAASLVFVQSRDGNTGADDPSTLGGGATDLHLIYEGLSRVAADGVLAGATTASGLVFFSVWHPAIVALRQSLGLPRHPAQIVLSKDGNLDLNRTLLFNVAEVPVYILGGSRCCERLTGLVHERPWISVIRIPDGDLASAMRELRQRGIGRMSIVGGRSVASALIDAGLVQDLCLTTTSENAGKPHTLFYSGSKRVSLTAIASKRTSYSTTAPIQVDQLLVRVD